jgi:hypothetical protein
MAPRCTRFRAWERPLALRWGLNEARTQPSLTSRYDKKNSKYYSYRQFQPIFKEARRGPCVRTTSTTPAPLQEPSAAPALFARRESPVGRMAPSPKLVQAPWT